jgi:hypothetical protein
MQQVTTQSLEALINPEHDVISTLAITDKSRSYMTDAIITVQQITWSGSSILSATPTSPFMVDNNNVIQILDFTDHNPTQGTNNKIGKSYIKTATPSYDRTSRAHPLLPI